MNPRQIKEIIEGAFGPHRCVAEIWDFGGYVRFQVTTEDDKRWTVGDPSKQPTDKIPINDIAAIREAINILRTELAGRGYQLSEWQWPDA